MSLVLRIRDSGCQFEDIGRVAVTRVTVIPMGMEVLFVPIISPVRHAELVSASIVPQGRRGSVRCALAAWVARRWRGRCGRRNGP